MSAIEPISPGGAKPALLLPTLALIDIHTQAKIVISPNPNRFRVRQKTASLFNLFPQLKHIPDHNHLVDTLRSEMIYGRSKLTNAFMNVGDETELQGIRSVAIRRV